VEDDGRTVYLYLQAAGEEGGIWAVWVANRLPAPEEDDLAAMQRGAAPLMPRRGTRHPQGLPPLDPESLSFVWFEEGDGVALLRDEQPLAVLPPWSGFEGFHGYSAEAIGEEQPAWPLEGALDGLAPRIEAARRYWEWRADPASWDEIRDSRLAHLEARLGPHRRYWAADGGRFPPRAVALFQPESYPGVSISATVGMSGQPMPQVEMYVEGPRPHRRVELLLAASGEAEHAPGLLSGIMQSPWQTRTWLGDGHTWSWDPPSERPGGSAVLLVRVPPPQVTQAGAFRRGVPAPNLSGLTDRGGDPVHFLWVLPITARERDLAASDGSQALLRKLQAEGRGWVW
jgi:hypothetical protein